MKLNSAQIDRACGAVLGSAVGDALGAGYEFRPALGDAAQPQMIGGGLGNFAPGEWTDDTTMAWCILDVAATGQDLRSEAALTAIGRNFRTWKESGPADIGIQTSQILGRVGPNPTAAAMTATAESLHVRTGRTAGNGSLMRTAPVALPYLDDPEAVVEAARSISALTHFDPRAQEACVLWSLAIRRAIVDDVLDLRDGLRYLDDEAVAYWTERIDEAETSDPKRFNPNGWVVSAFQAAWSAIVHSDGFAATLDTAIRIGHDTDTVAAIAGALIGAKWGASAIPAKWRRILHGYPGKRSEDLVHAAILATSGGPKPGVWPNASRMTDRRTAGVTVRHPFDDGVWLGDLDALDDLPAGVTAVVSLCRVGTEQVPPPGIEHICYRLMDSSRRSENPNLDFILDDAAKTVAALRDEGHEVLVHCVAAHSRTPAVGIAYALERGIGLDEATSAVCAALPQGDPNQGFRKALGRLAAQR
ncbi:MAG: ADP-ribosylglycohydrolase family protein [Gordonia amarae]